jgi:hypothetical protein
MIGLLSAVSTSLSTAQRFRRSLFDGFRTFLPYNDRMPSSDVFIRSNS